MTDTLVRTAPARRAWMAVAVAWCGSLAALVFWLLRTPTPLLRDQLRQWQPWSLDALVVTGVVAAVFVVSRMDVRSRRREIVQMILLGVLAASLTLVLAPRTNRIFYDEQIYQAIGQNMADLRRAQVCHDGSVEDGRLRCALGDYNKQPYAYPHLLSIMYRVAGVRSGAAFLLNAAAAAFTVCGVYLIVVLLFDDRDAALFAGLLIALMPEQLMWSATAAVEPTASLALVAAVLCAAYYARGGRLAALLLAAAVFAYAIQFRPESILIAPVIGLIAWPRLRLDLERPRGWWMATLFLAFVAVHLAHLFAVRNVGWGTERARFSLEYFAANLKVNGWFYLYDKRFPAIFTVLAAIGLLACWRHRVAWWTAIYFGVFFVIDLLFYAGSYNYGADVRYSLLTYPPIAVLGGLGAARVSRAMPAIGRTAGARWIVGALLLVQFLWYVPVVRAMPEEAWGARADVRFAEAFAKMLPPNSYVLTHNPGMFHMWGVSAGQMSLVASSPAYLHTLAQHYTGGVYLHWNFWCNAQDRVQQEICQKAIGAASFDVIREETERDQRFAVYRMRNAKTRTDRLKFGPKFLTWLRPR